MVRSQRLRSKDRTPGGQPGHSGSGLSRTEFPDRVERPDPPAECSSCGERLGDAADAGEGWAQVWDIPPIELEKVPWLRPQAALRVLRVLREDDHRRSAVRPARPGLLRA